LEVSSNGSVTILLRELFSVVVSVTVFGIRAVLLLDGRRPIGDVDNGVLDGRLDDDVAVDSISAMAAWVVSALWSKAKTASH
jgi:hypothetical protein